MPKGVRRPSRQPGTPVVGEVSLSHNDGVRASKYGPRELGSMPTQVSDEQLARRYAHSRRARSNDRLAHEPERDPARLAAVLHPNQSAFGDHVAGGSDPLASAGGTSAALAGLGQRGLGRLHGGGILAWDDRP